jgi:3-oxoacyl-[acyl-carrier protein] reductase
MKQRVNLITLGVSDLGRARGFYERLGWRTGAAAGDDVVFFQAGDMIVALWDRARLAEDSTVADAGGWGGVTLALNLGSPAEVDAAIEEARGAGATIGREPAEAFGAATAPSSSIPTDTPGRSPTTPTGRSPRTAASGSTDRTAADWPISQRPFQIASRADFHDWIRRSRLMGLLDGKAAIVTGSARGIGRATAEMFAAEGAKVLINDLDADVAEQAASEIDGETAVHAGDLTQPEAADKLVAAGVEAFGAVDIVVNNAGYTWDSVAHKMTDEQFQAMLDIHTIVPFRVARALAPHWREAAKAERGEGKEVFRKIVNVSSTSGMMGNAGQVNYSAAKMAVVGFTKTLAKEWGQFKINVNAVAFGFVETRLTAAKEQGGEMTSPTGEKIELGIPEQMRTMASAIIPLGRPATPEEASAPILFLCSPLANYVHGQVLNVTGGMFGGMYT